MKQGRLLSTILFFLLSLSLCVMCGCSSDSSGDNGDSVAAATLTALSVTATPDAINPNETTTIVATAYDASGNTIPNVTVVFTLDDPSMASITGTAKTNENGAAQVVLVARNTFGEVNVTATAGNISSETPATVTILGSGVSVDVVIAALDVIATPDSINPNETTSIKATAYDGSGNTISGVDVVFSLDDPTLAFITSAATTDSNGVAQVFLTARDKSGEVNVSAAATSENSNVTSDTPATVTIQDGATPDHILLTITPASVIAEGTATVQAQVLDANGDAVANGTSVSFVSNNTTYGNFTTATATTTNGYASATFKAANVQGTAALTVTCVGISAQGSLTIYPAQTATIEFVSATPQRIALQGTGTVDFPDFSTLQYIVKDTNGNPKNGELVSFVLSGPNGGEYIDATPGDPTPGEIEGSTDADGVVEVTLHSGVVAGPATIIGSITVSGTQGQNITIKSQSSVVSIGGGIPSDKRFSVAADVLNLSGLDENDVKTHLTAYLADRFGNYNVLVGTTVSFICERGLAIDTSDVTVDEDGKATAEARTQWPYNPSPLDDVAEEPWETALINYIESKYQVSLPAENHPREGLVSVTVYVKGEEHFWDENGNGYYDSQDTFNALMDTYDDPFIDVNDDGLWDNGTLDPFEEYIDTAGNGIWNGKNGVWDADKNIYTNFGILLTSRPAIITSDVKTFNIANGGYADLSILVCDRNYNYLVGGSTVSISTDKGKLTGPTNYTFPDTNGLGPLELSIRLSDSQPEQAKQEAASVTVRVNWGGAYATETYDYVVSGTIN